MLLDRRSRCLLLGRDLPDLATDEKPPHSDQFRPLWAFPQNGAAAKICLSEVKGAAHGPGENH